jgi:uncharacterized membrane protein
MTSVRERARRDDGSTLILAIFYGMICLILILLVTAATSLYLERKRLFSLADAAALVGAESFELSTVSVTDGVPRVSLSSSGVHNAVERFLLDNPTGTFEELRLEQAASIDGRSATVSLSSYWRPPALTAFLPNGIRLDVTSVARSVFR